MVPSLFARITSEVSLVWVYFPPFFFTTVIGFICTLAVAKALNASGISRFFWHPGRALWNLYFASRKLHETALELDKNCFHRLTLHICPGMNTNCRVMLGTIFFCRHRGETLGVDRPRGKWSSIHASREVEEIQSSPTGTRGPYVAGVERTRPRSLLPIRSKSRRSSPQAWRTQAKPQVAIMP